MKKIIALAVFLLIVLQTYLGCSTKSESQKAVKISGVIKATGWDENDNVSEIAIMVTTSTKDQEFAVKSYIVSYNKNEKELYNLIGSNIEAKGTIGEDNEGRKTIAIESYKVVENENTGYSDEDEF